ncbi:MAG: hypothetical protein ACXAC7_00900 [Candidatus Hodarchaeales archaeon]|jgi:predicted P-loop ATPase/GTPase
MKILVTGIQEKNSGKTFFTTQLAKLLMNYDKMIDFCVYKPISGSNFFYQASNTQFALKYGTIISKDIRSIYKQLFPADYFDTLKLELYNPIHTLFIPHNTKKYFENRLKANITIDTVDQPGIIRYTISNNSKTFENRLLVNDQIKIPKILKPIIDNAQKIEFFETIKKLQEIDEQWTQLAIESTWKSLISKIIIVESFNDYLPPPFVTKQIDLVVLIGPGIVAKIDKERFKQALTLIHTTPSMDKIVELTGTEEILEIPFHQKREDLNKPVWKQIFEWINIT